MRDLLDDMVIVGRSHRGSITERVSIALGVNLEVQKEVLGSWLEAAEEAKFWLGIQTELKNRELEDIFIACVDGLKGFPEAIDAVDERTNVQLCIMHMVCNNLKYVS